MLFFILALSIITYKTSEKYVSVFNYTNSEDRVIYLTFDDGPNSTSTGNILDILKEYNVKGTFFLVGNRIKGREEILKRIHNEGHGIGLHSYTHNYKEIYSSYDSFINDMQETSEEINRVLEIEPKIIRFPGGSCNRLNSELLQKLHERNYKIFDWTSSTGDGVNPNLSIDDMINNAVKTGYGYSHVFMLLHDKNKTCKVLPRIIEYYKKAGYTFKIITETTSEYHFKSKM